jgi:uncharacterized protein (DUF952 family)
MHNVNRDKSNALIYKIVARAAFEAAEKIGVFTGSADDHRDGYIHFSTAKQAEATAAKHFRGMDDLLILAVDTSALGAALKWEASRGGALFPHLYAPLDLRHVRWHKPLPLGRDGLHRFPLEMI